jgi:hypothetical protein
MEIQWHFCKRITNVKRSSSSQQLIANSSNYETAIQTKCELNDLQIMLHMSGTERLPSCPYHIKMFTKTYNNFKLSLLNWSPVVLS